MYFSLIVTFLLFVAIIIAAIQNSTPVNLKLLAWEVQMSAAALIFYSFLAGGVIVSILTLPKLMKKSHRVKAMNREINNLNEKMKPA
ncbi:MAG: LapA family protein [Desulfobacteraceae bacterium]|nr:LapA family protein [Desulfobacteraceae bacterium]